MSIHLRAYVVDQETRQPAASVPVEIVAAYGDQSAVGACEMPIRLLDSDHLGYVSTDLPVALEDQGLKHVWVRPFGRTDFAIDALPALRSGYETTVFSLPVPGDLVIPDRRTRPTRPAFIAPTTDDWRISPGSFTTPDRLRLGQGDCEELSHNVIPERRYRVVQLVREVEPPRSLRPLDDFEVCESAGSNTDEMWPPTPSQRCYRLGVMLTYEIAWEPVGHGLGRVVYSLPLAPCEAVDIAVIDWQRQDTVRSDENITNTEELRHSQLRDRDIEETLDAVLKEEQLGGSFMTGIAGAFGMGGGSGGGAASENRNRGSAPYNLGITAALGGAASGTKGKRTLGAETTQRLIDSINQATSVARRFNSTVIVQASSAEGETIQTRTVRNHNHCHALTVLYHEVVRHYRVTTRLVDKQDVVFVQYRPINDLWWPERQFTDAVILRHHAVLRAALLEPAVACGFEAIAKRFCQRQALAETTASLSSDDNLLGVVEVVIVTADTSENLGRRGLSVVLQAHGQAIPLIHGEEYAWSRGRELVPPDWLGGFRLEELDTEAPQSACGAGQEDVFLLRAADRVRWGAISGVIVEAPAGYRLQSLRVRTRSGEVVWTLVDRDVDHLFTNTPEGKSLRLVVNHADRRTADLALSPLEACCRAGLLQHLEDHKLYYSRMIWLSQDPGERAMIFDRYAVELPHPDRAGETVRGRLSDYIKNEIVGVSGDYVAFPLLASTLAEEVGESNASIRAGRVQSASMVALPTRGVFAEVKLSHCNGCERRDPTRYWRWEESPCPEPPEIGPIEAGAHEPADLGAAKPTTLPGPVVNIVNPPSAPDPSGLAAAFELLRTPNIFRDMSATTELSALLQKLAEGAVSLAGAQAQARDIVARHTEPAASPSRTSAAERHDDGAVVEDTIDRAEQEGHIPPEEANRLRMEHVRGVVRRSSPPPESPT